MIKISLISHIIIAKYNLSNITHKLYIPEHIIERSFTIYDLKFIIILLISKRYKIKFNAKYSFLKCDKNIDSWGSSVWLELWSYEPRVEGSSPSSSKFFYLFNKSNKIVLKIPLDKSSLCLFLVRIFETRNLL